MHGEDIQKTVSFWAFRDSWITRAWPHARSGDKQHRMRRGKNCGLLIAGGGVAGCFAALAMARLRPESAMVLVGEEVRFGGGSGMLLLDAGLSADERELLAPVVARSWDSCYVALPSRSR